MAGGQWPSAGHLPPPPRAGNTQPRVLGSRLDPDQARAGRNFLTPTNLHQVRKRLEEPERHQLIKQDRLWGDLLSSQPLCFNLFGELAADLELATKAARAWWPGRVEQVTGVRFEWSPGRRDLRYLGNRTAFDAAFLHGTSAGGCSFIGGLAPHRTAGAASELSRSGLSPAVASRVPAVSTPTPGQQP